MNDPHDEQARLQAAYAEMAARHGAGYHSLDDPAVAWMEAKKKATLCSTLLHAGLLDLAERPILEIGCGSGGILPYLAELGATSEHLHGVDLQPDRIAAAQAKLPRMQFQVADARQLPFAAASFDAVATFTVFSSILAPEMRWAVAREIERVLRPDGILLWYDMRWPNPANRHIRPVTRQELTLLFPGWQVHVAPHTLAPPLARRLAGKWPKLAERLLRLPLLRSHLMGHLRKG